MARIRIDPALETTLVLAPLLARGVAIREEAPALWEEIAALCAVYRRRYEGVKPGAIEALRPSRDLYRACGVDPTRRRPASEALLRRVLQGKALYRISNAVDCCNYCSLRFLLPIGMYDAAALEGDVSVRLGREGEEYRGLGKDSVGLAGQIVLADDAGPFGHPSGDSFRTRVRETTTTLLWVILAPAGYEAAALADHVAVSREWLERCCGGVTETLA